MQQAVQQTENKKKKPLHPIPSQHTRQQWECAFCVHGLPEFAVFLLFVQLESQPSHTATSGSF